MTNIIIIGAGVIGCAVARELSRFEAKITVLEKGNDVAVGASKANSGIVHAGFDAHPGSAKAYYNVKGAALFSKKAAELDFPFRTNGALVLNFDQNKTSAIEDLYNQGIANGVSGLEIISGDRAREMEPEISDSVVNALYAPTSGIVSPYEMTIAYAENAATNDVEFLFEKEVYSLEKNNDEFTIKTADGDIFTADCVINCAGVYGDVINNMICTEKHSIIARKGEYDLLDKSYGNITDKTLFQLPTAMGKGVLVAPTTHGNIIVGPTAADTEEKDNANTSPEGLKSAWEQASLSVKSLPKSGIITQFAGLRAHSLKNDFTIGESDTENFYNCIGIESPGLTSAPAIGETIAETVSVKFSLPNKTNFIAERKAIPHFAALNNKQRAELIAQNPLYGNIVCRCEVVTEGEIVEAIHRKPGAKDIDGIKRRTRAGMGRCQAGFCTPKIMEILSRELNIPIKNVTKFGNKSSIILDREDNKN